jgi:hypothetical protein
MGALSKDHKKFMADWINLLHGSVDVASHSPQHICIVTDTSTPSLPPQSVTAFHLWHEGDLYDNWSAAGLAMSDNAKLQAITVIRCVYVYACTFVILIQLALSQGHTCGNT